MRLTPDNELLLFEESLLWPLRPNSEESFLSFLLTLRVPLPTCSKKGHSKKCHSERFLRNILIMICLGPYSQTRVYMFLAGFSRLI